jgi:SlyX protein
MKKKLKRQLGSSKKLIMHEDRIIELEIKVAYQEDLIQELNKIVGQQQQQITRLEATCKLLNERIKSLSNVISAEESIDQSPPHY